MKSIALVIILFIVNTANASIESCLKKLPSELPDKLSSLCLFKDINHKLVYPEYLSFTPRFPLYTDGMDKKRWIYIPKGKLVDTTDVDNWNFPKGTILFKEFSTKGLILETRVMYKIASGMSIKNWKWATYQWNKKQNEAQRVDRGVRQVLGTIHNIPANRQCFACHRGSKDMVLGFAAIQLSNTDPNSPTKQSYLKTLIDKQLITSNIKPFYKVPARNEQERKALGYLHGNCSHCHSKDHPMGGLGMHLKLKANTKTSNEHEAIKTTINVPTRGFYLTDFRVNPNNIQDSALYIRLNSIQSGIQMAPIGKSTIDHQGVKVLKDWIESL